MDIPRIPLPLHGFEAIQVTFDHEALPRPLRIMLNVLVSLDLIRSFFLHPVVQCIITMPVARRPQVVIIGAGFAGLGAAQRLLSDSSKRFDVTVLEGSSKVGGRIKSVTFSGGCQVELGATFLYHFPSFNLLGEYVQAKGFADEIEDFFDELEDADYSAVRLLSSGETLPRAMVKHYQNMYFKVQEELRDRARCGDWNFTIDNKWGKAEHVNLREISYEEYMAKILDSILDSGVDINGYSAAREQKSIFESLNLYEAFMNGTTRSKNVELTTYGDFAFPNGQLALKGSYQDIADTIARDLPPPSLHLNSEVQSVQWTPRVNSDEKQLPGIPPVTIVCKNGSTFQADHVIVTVSLGVLQQNCDPSVSGGFFIPQLPQAKLSSIMKLGMGKGCRVALEFPRPLIDGKHRSIELYWLENELDKQFLLQYPWVRKQYILLRAEESNVYASWFSGEEAVAVEKVTDFELTNGMCLMLEKFLRKPISRPIRIERSTWCGDKLFLGSYSYQRTRSSVLDREVLSQPVSGSTPLQLLFAGEATHPTLYSTTNGAYESGIREADRLLNTF